MRLFAYVSLLIACVLAWRPLPTTPSRSAEPGLKDAGARLERAINRLSDVERGVPRLEGGELHWTSRDADGTRWCRRGTSPGSPTEVLVDEGVELNGQGDVGTVEVSGDDVVAFTADPERDDRYGVRVKRLGHPVSVEIVDDADFSVAWAKDDDLYFTRFGGDERPKSLWRLEAELRNPPVLVAALPDGDDREFLVANVDDRAEVFVRDGDDVDSFVVGGSDDGEVENGFFGLRSTIR